MNDSLAIASMRFVLWMREHMPRTARALDAFAAIPLLTLLGIAAMWLYTVFMVLVIAGILGSLLY